MTEEREHELGGGGQRRDDIAGEHGVEGSGGAINETPKEQPSDGQPNDEASELGGQTMSQADQDREELEEHEPRADGEDRNERGRVNEPTGEGVDEGPESGQG
ncbi:MAG: hypothetical protein LC722_01630 [Actinobacteria bacterium]|nr:hypothetical protein [Actinomycetota bacterium]